MTKALEEEKSSPKKAGPVMVALSAAVAAINPLPAIAQVSITCSRAFFVGENIACNSSGFGQYTIRANGATNVGAGCLFNERAPVVGQCIVFTGGVPPVNNVEVKVVTNEVFIKDGGNSARVNNFRISYTGNTGQNQILTLTPTEVSNTATINIGGSLRFSSTQSLGSYTGQISVSATEIP